MASGNCKSFLVSERLDILFYRIGNRIIFILLPKCFHKYFTIVLWKGSSFILYLILEIFKFWKAVVEFSELLIGLYVIKKEGSKRVRFGQRDFLQLHINNKCW